MCSSGQRPIKKQCLALLGLAATGCSSVTFEHRPPPSYLDLEDHLVGTIGIEEPDRTRLFTLSKPDAAGRRIMWCCFPESSNAEDAPGKYETERMILYLYKIGGRRYAFTKPESEQNGFTAVRVDTRSGGIRLYDIATDHFLSSWPTRNFRNDSNGVHCFDSSQEIVDALTDDKISDLLFTTEPQLTLDPSTKSLNSNGEVRSLSQVTISMRLPDETSRALGLFAILFSFACGFGLVVDETAGKIILANESAETLRSAGLHRDAVAVVVTAILYATTVMLFVMITTFSTNRLSILAFAVLSVAMACGQVVGGWLTVENHSLVQLIANTIRWRTLIRALIPVGVCVLLVLPGFIATTWVESQVLGLATSVPESVAIDIPGVSGYRPVVREPTWNDGWIKCAFGVPVVDQVKYEIEGQRLSFESLSVWRSALVNILSLMFTLTLLALVLMLLRVIIGIVLRIAATDEEQGVSYCPAN